MYLHHHESLNFQDFVHLSQSNLYKRINNLVDQNYILLIENNIGAKNTYSIPSISF